MRIILWIMCLPLLAATCKTNKSGGALADIPACIQTRIDSIKNLPKWNPPATVEEYRYKGQRVFLFSSDCCDQYNQVLDSSCAYICAPTGGITGGGDGRCSDFEKEAGFVKLVWKDPR